MCLSAANCVHRSGLVSEGFPQTPPWLCPCWGLCPPRVDPPCPPYFQSLASLLVKTTVLSATYWTENTGQHTTTELTRTMRQYYDDGHWSSAVLDCPPSGTQPFRLPLLVAGTIYLSTSLLHLSCLSPGRAPRLISSPFPIPVPDHVQCSRSDTFILDTWIVHVAYLLNSHNTT